MVLVQGARLSLAGLALGFLVALAASRLLEGPLFGVSPQDPQTYLLVAAGLAGVALAARWLPARKALSVDPSLALRCD
jgi:ABC-type antimicrobial peptide transport system permease subunit